MTEAAAPLKAEEAPQGACIKIDIAFPGPPSEDDFASYVLPVDENNRALPMGLGPSLREKYDAGTVQEIRIREVFYRLNSVEALALLDACYELLTTQGHLVIHEPYYTWGLARTDPLFRSSISERTFYYYDRTWLKKNNISREFGGSDVDFNTEVVVYVWEESWKPRAAQAKEWHRTHCNNVVKQIQFSLRPRKG